MKRFITNFGLVRGVDPWKKYRLIPISRQEEVKNITILVRNESLRRTLPPGSGGTGNCKPP